MFYLRSSVVFVALTVLLGGEVSSLHAQQRPKAIGQLQTRSLAPSVIQTAEKSVRGSRQKDGEQGPMAKIGLELALLYHQYQAEGPRGIRRLREAPERSKRASSDPRTVRSRVRSPIAASGRTVIVEALSNGEGTALLSDLRRLGMERGAAMGRLVSGRLPISALREAAELSTLRGMVPSYARSHAGSVGSEADTAHAAYRVRSTFNLDGTGQKVCALSDSYNQSSSAATTAEDDIQSGDLPGEGNPQGNTQAVDVLDDDYGGSPAPTDEGRAMLQLIHDIAPGATLGFHTAFGGLADFANGILELANPNKGDCDVIVDDVGYAVEPFYQDGILANAVDEAVQTYDAAYFSSAGNDGRNAYRAPFRDSGHPGVLSDDAVAHDFAEGAAVDTLQQVTVAPGGTFRIFTLQWTDPSGVVEGSAGPDTDLDVAILDDTLGVVAKSENQNIDSGFPVESLEFSNAGEIDTDEDGVADSTFHLVIEKAAGPDPDEVRYIYSGSQYSIDQYDTLGATIYGHPKAEGAMAVAAAPFFYTPAYVSVDAPFLESFSSKGGIPIRFDQTGNRISPVDREKPDVTGTDAIDNTFFGNDLQFPSDSRIGGVDSDPHPNFFGTSAAAPNIAAIAALIRQSRPSLSYQEVYNSLRSGTQDITQRITREGELQDIGEGRDPWSGTGFVLAEEAVPPPRTLQIVNLAADGTLSSRNEATLELSWSLVGEGQVDAFLVERQFFDGPFTEQTTVTPDGERQFSNSIENLPPGKHTFRITAVRNDSVITTSTTERILQAGGANVMLYPNPFRERTNVSVTLPSSGGPEEVRVSVYDALGRRVATPVEARSVDATQSITLTPSELGISGAGMYFFRVKGESFTRTVQGVYSP